MSWPVILGSWKEDWKIAGTPDGGPGTQLSFFEYFLVTLQTDKAGWLSLWPGHGRTGELAMRARGRFLTNSLWARVQPPRMTSKEVSKDLSRIPQTMMLP